MELGITFSIGSVSPVGMFRVAIQCVFAPTEKVQSSRGASLT